MFDQKAKATIANLKRKCERLEHQVDLKNEEIEWLREQISMYRATVQSVEWDRNAHGMASKAIATGLAKD